MVQNEKWSDIAVPNWKTHLEVGKRLQKWLKYSGEDYHLFLLGNVLPDINNGYIVKNISTRLPHHHTHFSDDETPSYIRFENDYQGEMRKSPLVYGYFTHLFTDYYWNNDYYTKIDIRGMASEDHTKLRIMKQDDFKVYNNKFIENTFEILDFNTALQEIKRIHRVSITKEDILEVENFLNRRDTNTDKNFQFYQEQELDELLEKTVDELLKMRK